MRVIPYGFSGNHFFCFTPINSPLFFLPQLKKVKIINISIKSLFITTGDIMTNFEPPKRRFFGATRQGIDGRGLIGPGPGQYDADWYSQSERGAARGNCAPKVSSLTMKRGQDPHNFAPLYRGFQSIAKRQCKI